MTPILYVDYDGTIVDDSIDSAYISMSKDMGKERALSVYRDSPDLWDRMLKLNIMVLLGILLYKLVGFRVVLFTNRFPIQLGNVVENLGGWILLFDDFIFGEGYKDTIPIHGVLWDNDPRYASCVGVKGFKLIDTFKG